VIDSLLCKEVMPGRFPRNTRAAPSASYVASRVGKYGGGQGREHADLDTLDAGAPADEILTLQEALEQFAAHDPLKAKLVELRFFGGLTLAQAAECLNISLSTADRAWRYARAWLYDAISADDPKKS
jgi:DNA-directed RNA polymerase specialized sigma24 family protein